MNSTEVTFNENNETWNFNNNSIINPELGEGLNILQLNIEGISEQKCDYLTKLNSEERIDVAVIQETHIVQKGNRSNVCGFTMVASQHHEKFGIATYVKDDLLPSTVLLPSASPFCAGIKLNEISIINVYKPPSADFDDQVFPSFEKPSVVIGDFNSHNTV